MVGKKQDRICPSCKRILGQWDSHDLVNCQHVQSSKPSLGIDKITGELSTFEDWLATRPANVQVMGKEFPIGTSVVDPDGVIMYVVGYTEENCVIFSSSEPGITNYEKVTDPNNLIYMDIDHLRNNSHKITATSPGGTTATVQ